MTYLSPDYFPPRYFPATYFGGAGDALAPALPNTRRMLSVDAPGYAGVFTAYTVGTSDVATFDLSGWLNALGNPGEAVTAVSFDLTPINKDGTTDADPEDRQTGLITIQGFYASQRFGNWQDGPAYIMYRVEAVAKTNQNNTISFWAYIPVYNPIA